MGGSKKVTIGYKYFMGLHMGLCAGPVDKVDRVTAGDRTVLSENMGAGYTTWISQPDLFGGDKKEGGIAGQFELLMGDADQQPNAYLQSQLGSPLPAFRGLCCAVFHGEVSSMQPYIKPWAFRVFKCLQGWRTPVWQPALCAIGKGMNAAHFYYRCITDPVTGLGKDPEAALDLDRLLEAAQTLHDEGLGLCLRWSRRDATGNFIQVLCDHVGGMTVDDPVTGKQYLKLLRGDYDIDAVPALDESNITSMDSFEIPSLSESINEVQVTYRDIETNKDAQVTVQNLANIQAQGRVVSQTTQYPGIWNADLATRVAMRDLKAQSSMPARLECKVRGDVDVRRGDVLAFTWPRLNLVKMPMRVLEVERPDATGGDIALKCSQDVYSLPTSTYVVVEPGRWAEPDRTPRPVSAQTLMESTYRDLAAVLRQADLDTLTDDAGYLAAFGVRPANALAFNYALDTRPGTTGDFREVEEGDFTPSALLATAMPVSADPMEVLLTSGVDLQNVAVGTAVLIDDEICRVEAIDPAVPKMTLARGCVDTVPAAHAIDARLWCYDDGYAGADPTQYIDGETVQAKLLTQTGSGKLALADAITASLVMDQRQARPYPPGNLTVAGEHYPESVTVDFPLAWSHRDRLLQADQLIDTAQTDIGPEAGTTYTVRTYLDDVLKHTYAAVDGNTFTPDRLDADGELRVEVEAVRDALQSRQPLVAAMNYQWLYTMDQTPFGAPDGSINQFQLVNAAGQPITSDITIASIHQTDWQGRVELSDQPRTNYAPTSDLATGAGWNVYGNSTRTMNFGYGAGPDGRSSGQFVFSSVLNDNGVQFGTTAPVTGEPWSIVSRLKNDGAADLAVRLRSQFGAMNVVVPADGAWHRYQYDLVIGDKGQLSTFFRPVEVYLGGSSEGSIEVGAVFVGKTADVGAYIANTTDSPVILTDYTHDGQGGITTGQVPDADATLDWSGKGR